MRLSQKEIDALNGKRKPEPIPSVGWVVILWVLAIAAAIIGCYWLSSPSNVTQFAK